MNKCSSAKASPKSNYLNDRQRGSKLATMSKKKADGDLAGITKKKIKTVEVWIVINSIGRAFPPVLYQIFEN